MAINKNNYLDVNGDYDLKKALVDELIDEANEFNTHEEEHFTDAHTAKYYARIQAGGGQSMPNSTFTSLALNGVAYDSTGDMAPGARLVSRKTGLYLIVGSIFYDANDNGARHARLQGNDSNALATVRLWNAGAVPTEITVTTFALLNNGDYVRLQGYQSSGGSLGVQGSLTMAKIG